MDGHQDATAANAALVTFCFVLGNAGANQGSGESTDRTANADTTEHPHDGSGGDERADSRDGECADAGEPAQSSSNHCAGRTAGYSTLRRLRLLFVREIFRALVIGE